MMGFTYDSMGQSRGPKRQKYGHSKSKKGNKKQSSYKGGAGKRSYGGGGNREYWTVGFSFNSMNYFGDLSPGTGKVSSDVKLTNLGVGVTGSYVLGPGLFARAAFNIGAIEGNDFNTKDPGGDASNRGRYSRNLQFKNLIKELTLGFEFDVFPNNNGARGRFPINPYLFGGVGIIHHAPKAIAPEFDQAGNPTGAGGDWVDLRSLGTEGQNIEESGKSPYKKFEFVIPAGLGVKIRLPANFDLNFEIGIRYLFTDYLDDVSDTYADLALFGDASSEEANLARAMSERGAEPTNLMTGSERNTEYYNANPSGPYVVGDGYAPAIEGSRGGPGQNDFYVISQLRLVYIFDSKGSSRGKFR